MTLRGDLTDVIIFFFRAQRKEQHTNWIVPAPLHSVLTEISRLVDEQQQQQSPESKRVADLSRVCLPSSSLMSLPSPTLFFFPHTSLFF
jgi:hypothetical protein